MLHGKILIDGIELKKINIIRDFIVILTRKIVKVNSQVKSNASKVGLYFLCQELKHNNYRFIDCQVPSQHLRSLGAVEISRDNFLKKLFNQNF